jgi:RecB family exonuclease
MMRALVVSPAADRRLERAAAWLAARGRAEQILIVGANPEGPAELVRAVAQRRGAAFGWARSTLGREAARLARGALAARGLAAVGPLPLEALAARVIDHLAREGALGRLQPVAGFPGLPRALARTLAELRLAGIDPAWLGPASEELAGVHRAYEAELLRAGLADRAVVFRLAIEEARRITSAPPLLLLDPSVHAGLERELCAALAARSPDVLATVPEGDPRTLENLRSALGAEPEPMAPGGAGSLRRLQAYLFSGATAPRGELGEEVVLLSAPGESRECVEIARLVQREAGRGVPFDRMAILLRAPAQYRAHLEEALRRAEVPAYFARGTVQPDPAGRAFVALLACAAEGLSARRFAEYLSLGQVPDVGHEGAPPEALPAADRWVPPEDELAAHLAAVERDEVPAAPPVDPLPVAEADLPPVISGTLRAPRRWERLLIEAAVLGGLDRWETRLLAFERKLTLDLAALDVTADPEIERVKKSLSDLLALRRFALPLLGVLAALPERATWGVWLERLGEIASRSLRKPERVLATLAALHPMDEVGPVDLAAVRLALDHRFTDLVVLPEERAAGRVFVAPVDAARGLAFDVVFVPGVAERLFPPKVSEDPILRDRERAVLGLDTNDERVAAERLALRVAVGAARERLFLSYPRVDLDQSRPRVPSFYGLEVMRAAEGALPGFDELARRAEAVGGARIGWPAPERPERAIDDAEYDLALLDKLFALPEEQTVGTARYLLSANAHLARALRFRARRWTLKKWLPADGLVDPTGRAKVALDGHALSVRSYAPTALEKFAACPYQFLLHAVHRLSPPRTAEPVDALDPRQRGILVHETLYELSRALLDEGLLPPSPATLERARTRLHEVLDHVARRFYDELAPAVERVWRDQIAILGADLGEWLRRVADDAAADRGWTPLRFELSFGLSDRRARDPASLPAPAELACGIKLRGSIDLVEQSGDGALRATDYKTGKVRATEELTVIDGGHVLQPVLYALALERLFPDATVEAGRLYYCTSMGGFEQIAIPLDDEARAAASQVAATIGGAISEGFLPAAPEKDACTSCAYRVVCGPYEETRVALKNPERLFPLRMLRARP